MFLVALVVLVIAVLLLLVGLIGGAAATTLDFGWFDLDANATVAFVLGMVCLALFFACWRLFRSATRQALGRRRDRKRISELNSQLGEYQRRERADTDRQTSDTEPVEPQGRESSSEGGRPTTER